MPASHPLDGPPPKAARFPRRATALVVDEDDSVRSLIRYILQRQSFEVETASGTVDALSMLESGRYDVVVLDPNLRDPGTWELLEFLRDRSPAVLERVILLTAAVDALQHGLPAHFCRVLTKPFEIDDLVEAVAGCAGGENTRDA